MRLPDGTLDETVISRDEAAALADIRPEPAVAARPADADHIRLLVESTRIRLAYAYDRQFAVSLLRCILHSRLRSKKTGRMQP